MGENETVWSTGTTLAGLLEALPEPIVLVDTDMRVAAANAAARAILSMVRLSDPLEWTIRSPDVLDCVRRVSSLGRSETASWRERVPVERAFEVHVAPLMVAGDHVGAVVITLRDLTEARALERMRVDFVANASHELRTPLASLIGFVETLQGPAKDDPVARERFLGIMREQAGRMARLIDDLLSLSRIEQNLHLRPEAAVDLGMVARHVAEALAPLAQENNVRIVVEAEQPVIVRGDRDEIVRIAENLIENAVKYGAVGPDGMTSRVDVSIKAGSREGVLVVRDHGDGIAPEHIPRLTERFYRVDAGQSRAKGGTGLGLAIVKHIVARHRGRLTIDSAPGEGASFLVALPLHGRR